MRIAPRQRSSSVTLAKKIATLSTRVKFRVSRRMAVHNFDSLKLWNLQSRCTCYPYISDFTLFSANSQYLESADEFLTFSKLAQIPKAVFGIKGKNGHFITKEIRTKDET